MCVGVPVQVIRSEGSGAFCRDARGGEVWIDLLLTGPQAPGTWLMSFLGAARAVIDEGEALRTLAALDALEALMNGRPANLDAAFADLIAHPPRLPDFLRGDTT